VENVVVMSELLPERPTQPSEQLPVPLFDGVVLAVRDADGLIYLALRDLCATLSLNLSAQRRRINANDTLHLVAFRVIQGNQIRTLDFLPLDDLALWLLSIQERRVGAEVRERLGYVKRYLEASVRAAFANLTGLPDGPSSQVEDLAELDRVDQVFKDLAELGRRQAVLETSQDRARIAYRDLATLVAELRERIAALEHGAKQRLSPSQRNTLYRLVQQWGTARGERDERRQTGTAIRKAWIEFNTRFAISTYTDLPAARYDEAIQFIKERYRTLTGNDIDAVEQPGLDLEV
jgi:hypothetical protein